MNSPDVEEGGSADNFDLAWIEGDLLQDRSGELAAEVNTSVALPVSTDEKFA